ncbi:MAG: hypothetical protein K1X83_03550 [Oligoflexia bacterium]|nr:hypothetical protein [Oligoflexia bacterium]
MFSLKFSPDTTGGRTLVGDLTDLKHANQRVADEASRLYHETVEISRRMSRAADGTESILQHEAQSARWRFFRNLRSLEEGNHPAELKNQFSELAQSFDQLWKGVEQRWFPREIGGSLSEIASQMDGFREALRIRNPHFPDLSVPSSEMARALTEEKKSKGTITDEDVYLYVHRSNFLAEKLTEAGLKMIQAVSTSLTQDFLTSRQRLKMWEGALQEMRQLGWVDEHGRIEIRAVPLGFEGAPMCTLRVLGNSEAGAFLKDRLELQREINKLAERKGTLVSEGHNGFFSAVESWWIDQRLLARLGQAQKPPSNWITKTFRETSEISLFSDEAGVAVTGDAALKRCAEDFVKRALALELRWGSYQANLEGSTANAILMSENLSSVEDRRLGKTKAYGQEFNRAILGEILFEYASTVEPLPDFLSSISELAAAQLPLLPIAELEEQIAEKLREVETSEADPGPALTQLTALLDARDISFLANSFSADLETAAHRIKMRIAAEYKLNPKNPLLDVKASPYLCGAQEALDQFLNQGYPTLLNRWFGLKGHPGMDHTPHANDYSNVPSVVYEVAVEFDSSREALVRKQLGALIAAGGLPTCLGSGEVVTLAPTSSDLRTGIIWKLEQPVQMPEARVNAVTEFVAFAVRRNLAAVLERQKDLRSGLEQNNVALGMALRCVPTPKQD